MKLQCGWAPVTSLRLNLVYFSMPMDFKVKRLLPGWLFVRRGLFSFSCSHYVDTCSAIGFLFNCGDSVSVGLFLNCFFLWCISICSVLFCIRDSDVLITS